MTTKKYHFYIRNRPIEIKYVRYISVTLKQGYQRFTLVHVDVVRDGPNTSFLHSCFATMEDHQIIQIAEQEITVRVTKETVQ